jgi:PAS domain S-box-containing protein
MVRYLYSRKNQEFHLPHGGGSRSEKAFPAIRAFGRISAYGTVFLWLIVVIAVPVSGATGPGLFFVMHDDLPPYEFTDARGQPSGYAYDLIQTLAKHTGLNITIIPEEEFGSGADPGPGQAFILPVFTRGSATGPLYISEPVRAVQYKLYARDIPGAPQEIMPGDMVIIPRSGSFPPSLFSGDLFLVAGADTPSDAFARLNMKGGDFALVEDLQGSGLLKHAGFQGIRAVNGFREEGAYTLMVVDSTGLYLPLIDEGIRDLRESGEMDLLATRWFTPVGEEEGGSPLLFYLFTPIALIALVVVSWSLAMRYQVAKKTSELESELQERCRAEDELSRARNQLDSIINSIADPVFVKDRDHRWILLNDAYCRFMGYGRDDLIGRSDYDFFPREEADVFWQKDEFVFETGRENINEENFTDASNNRHIIATKKALYNDPSGRKYIVGVIRDITGQKEFEEHLKKFNEELERRVSERTSALQRANRDLESFTYSVSHDLRAPLRAIDGFSSILLTEAGSRLSEPETGLLEKIRKNTQQMGNLIDDLLNFSRIGRKELSKTLTSPSEIARGVLDQLRAEQKGRDVRITLENLPACKADPVLLHQVYYNLISNSLKFTRNVNPVLIDIGSVLMEGKTAYFVKDNGIGFDMRYREVIFKPFQQLQSTPDYEGTGVGLAIVHRIITRHGGRIWPESEPGKGSTFFFTLE